MMVTDLDVWKKVLKLTYGPKHFSIRRAGFMSVLIPVYSAVYGLDALGRKLDDIFFPEYQDQEIGEPIFIMASPRSGTTFLHRLMSFDDQFTPLKLWQTLFPTVTAYRAMDALGALDSRLGNLLAAKQEKFAQDTFAVWDGIHRTRFDESEEDEAAFVLAMATPSVWMGVPFPDELPEVRYIDRGPKREMFSRFFKGTLQRHLWATRKDGEARILLAKNVLLANRLGIVEDAAPNSRFVQIIRHPYRTVASTMSFFTATWGVHSPEIDLTGPEVRSFAETCMEYVITVHRFMKALPEERGITIMYDDLIEDPEREIRKVYDRFGLDMSDKYVDQLRATVEAERDHNPNHSYSLEGFGLSEELVRERLAEIFEEFDLPDSID